MALRLLTFAAAETVLISDTGLASLINILQRIDVRASASEHPPEGSLIPLRWSAFSLWTRDTNDRGPGDFDHRVEVATPDGQVGITQESPLRIEHDKRTVQVKT